MKAYDEHKIHSAHTRIYTFPHTQPNMCNGLRRNTSRPFDVEAKQVLINSYCHKYTMLSVNTLLCKVYFATCVSTDDESSEMPRRRRRHIKPTPSLHTERANICMFANTFVPRRLHLDLPWLEEIAAARETTSYTVELRCVRFKVKSKTMNFTRISLTWRRYKPAKIPRLC